MRSVCPCKGCESRHPLCHAECEPYKEWQTESRKKRRDSAKADTAKAFLIDGCKKGKRERQRRHR